MGTVVDRGENVAMMEPLQISEGSPHRAALTELAVDLTAKSAGFRRSLPDGVVMALADLVRAMNCYYSNLIEGHNTHPIDIERALRNDYSEEPAKRNLQLEARAHVTVQEWVDTGSLDGRAATREGVEEVHRRFSELLPEELLWVDDPESGERVKVEPGALRGRDVRVGDHIAISAGALPRFLERFEAVYSQEGRYKDHLLACDQPRQGDLDGRGTRSEAALAAFTRFFLQTSIDQVTFMEQLVQPNRLRERIRLWVEEEARTDSLPPQSANVLEAIFYRGELTRGEVAGIVGTGDRQARRIVAALFDAGVLRSESTRSPLRIAFPAALAGRWMPGLFPEA